MKHAWTAGLAVMALAMAGCSGLTAEAKLEYDGSSNGSHSEGADCDDQAEVSGSGTLHDGTVRVTVEDDGGSTVFDETYTESFTIGDATVSGASGEWTLRAQRSGDDLAGDEFNGDYEVFLDCASITDR